MTRKSSAVEQFPGTPIDGPDVEKDGGFGMPSSATSGINNYDQEGARVKKPKKSKSKPRVEKDEDECMGKDESPNAPYDDFDDKDDAASKSATVDITKFERPALEAFYTLHKNFFDSEEMVKGVYDVASLGNLIAQLNSMADSQDMERKIEGDNSKIPEALRTEAAKLLKILSDMASEESEEISDGKTAEDVMRATQPAMSAGLFRSDISTMAKSLRDSLGLEKVGRRNSAKDLEKIQTVHDAACELGAECGHGFNDSATKHTGDVDMRKTDTIMAEGNKRGAAVSDPSMEPQSTNAEDAENTSDQGQEKPNNDTKKSKKRMDMGMAAKGKKRADMDDDDDDWDDSDDDTDEDDDTPPKAKKAKKSVTLDEESLAKVVASAVVAAMASMQKAAGLNGDTDVNIRNAPHLRQVEKSAGATQITEVNLDELKKSVTTHPKDLRGPVTEVDAHGIKTGDYGTATLIKAIHASGTRFMLKESDIPSPVQ